MSRPDTEGFYLSMGVKNIYKLFIYGCPYEWKDISSEKLLLGKVFWQNLQSERGSHNSEKKNKDIDVIVTHRSSRDTWRWHVRVTGVSVTRHLIWGLTHPQDIHQDRIKSYCPNMRICTSKSLYLVALIWFGIWGDGGLRKTTFWHCVILIAHQ